MGHSYSMSGKMTFRQIGPAEEQVISRVRELAEAISASQIGNFQEVHVVNNEVSIHVGGVTLSHQAAKLSIELEGVLNLQVAPLLAEIAILSTNYTTEHGARCWATPLLVGPGDKQEKDSWLALHEITVKLPSVKYPQHLEKLRTVVHEYLGTAVAG